MRGSSLASRCPSSLLANMEGEGKMLEQLQLFGDNEEEGQEHQRDDDPEF